MVITTLQHKKKRETERRRVEAGQGGWPKLKQKNKKHKMKYSLTLRNWIILQYRSYHLFSHRKKPRATERESQMQWLIHSFDSVSTSIRYIVHSVGRELKLVWFDIASIDTTDIRAHMRIRSLRSQIFMVSLLFFFCVAAVVVDAIA